MAKSIHSLSDNELIDVANQMGAAMNASPASYNTTAPEVAAFLTTVSTFQTNLTAQVSAIAASKAATVTKDTSRVSVENAMRSFRDAAKIIATDAQMSALGLPSSSDPAPSNATVPAASVNTSERLRHTISWTDAATLDNKKKPRGTMGAEIWVKIDGPPPGNEKDCVFLTLDAFTPYVSEYDPADAGKTAHYMLRWRLRDGSTSAFGETVSATITG